MIYENNNYKFDSSNLNSITIFLGQLVVSQNELGIILIYTPPIPNHMTFKHKKEKTILSDILSSLSIKFFVWLSQLVDS